MIQQKLHAITYYSNTLLWMFKCKI